MTEAQIDVIIALTGFDPLDTSGIKNVSLASGKQFMVNARLGAAGRYTATFDHSNDLVAFAPVTAAADGPEVVAAVEYVPYDMIESISIFPA